MAAYFLIKTIHIISSTILFGTGIGIAFFMFQSHFTENINTKLFAANSTVLADYLFTFPAVIVQPITGFWLMLHLGYDWNSKWLLLTFIIYGVAGLCWLPVVWIQIQLKKILINSVENNTNLPPRYFRLFKVWFLLGWPAFLGLVIIFFLMVMKPV